MSFAATLKKNVIKLDKWLDRHCTICFFLLIVTLLRLPNFFEPYWYGDEGIYLTIGDAITKGERLYADIVDHKTPGIYYLATVPNQLAFRVLLYFWMIISTLAFYSLAKKTLSHHLSAAISLLLFVTFTTLPWLEGHIPNGELFVMGFMLVGGYFITRLPIVSAALQRTSQKTQQIDSTLRKKEVVLLLSAGFLFGLGLLTKVPALFDAAAFFALFFFIAFQSFFSGEKTSTSFKKYLIFFVTRSIIIAVGFFTPLVLSILYFASIGAGGEYLNFGLLYNFHYSGTWVPSFDSALVSFFFTFAGKFFVLIGVFVLLVLAAHYVSTSFLFTAAWSILALFATLLSNRPYPHYFLQIVPPFALLCGQLVDKLATFFMQRATNDKQLLSGKALVLHVFLSLVIIFFALQAILQLKVMPYQTKAYYQSWWQYITGRIDRETYYNSFNGIMSDNYDAARIISSAGDRYSFIWGTNPALYALSDTIPAGRFTVSFHIQDLKDKGAYEETFSDIEEKQPTFIIVMKNEPHSFSALQVYIEDNYILYKEYDHFYLYKRFTQK